MKNNLPVFPTPYVTKLLTSTLYMLGLSVFMLVMGLLILAFLLFKIFYFIVHYTLEVLVFHPLRVIFFDILRFKRKRP